jgi:hypothetical protein
MTGSSPAKTRARIERQSTRPPLAIVVLAVKVEPLRASLTRTLTAPRGAGSWFASRVAKRKRPEGRFSSATRLESPSPRRLGAVIAKRPKRSAGAAQPLDGAGAAWPAEVGRGLFDLVRHHRNRSSV